jgi:hypothetical protein
MVFFIYCQAKIAVVNSDKIQVFDGSGTADLFVVTYFHCAFFILHGVLMWVIIMAQTELMKFNWLD